MKILKNDNGIHTIFKDNNNLINFCPSRGGLITNWVFNDYQILYFDQKRFLDKSKKLSPNKDLFSRLPQIGNKIGIPPLILLLLSKNLF